MLVNSATTVRLTMAQALVRFLDSQYISIDGEEIKYVEGILGIFGHGNVTGLGEALENESHQLRFIQGHNEQSLVHTATAYAKQNKRRKIMACTSSIGPGALNMVTGAATATTNRLPVLLLPGDIFACRQPDPVLQQLEHPMDYTCTVNDCFKPVSKYWDRITRPEQLMTACMNAMRVLTCPQETGAVTLCLPQDVQAESFEYPSSFFEKRIYHLDRLTVSPSSQTVLENVLSEAKSPLIIAGGGVVYADAEKELAQFSSHCRIPVAVTQAGKGVMLENHPYYVGGIGVTGTEVANKLAKQADLILALGTRLSDFTTASKTAFQHPQVKIINVNVNPLDGFKMDGVLVKADVKQALESLLQSEKIRRHQSDMSYQSEIADLKANWALEQKRVVTEKANMSGMNHQLVVLNAINEFVQAEDVIVSAAGSLPGDLHRFWRIKGRHSYHLEYAFSCMGYEVAAGLGVKIAHPDKEVYVIIGDGSFLMMHSALLDSLREKAKINVIVLDNQGFQCIQNLQRSAGSEGFGCEFSQAVSYSNLASSMGVASYFANNITELSHALKAAREQKQSTLIEIKVSPTSMSHGYETGWRVDVADVSKNVAVTKAHDSQRAFLAKAKQY